MKLQAQATMSLHAMMRLEESLAQLVEQDCAPAAALSQGQGCPGGRGLGQYVGLR